MKFGQSWNNTKEKKLSKKSMKNVTLELVPGPFNFQRILCEKEPEEVCMMICTNFNGFAITDLILRACFENFFFQ